MNTRVTSSYSVTLLTILLVAIVTSCSKDDSVVNKQEKYINSHRIPQEIAIKELESFLIDDDVLTKGGNGHRVIKSIECLTERVPSTKIGSDYNGLDTLIYIVNFDNQEGFAVLSADDRISSMIIAVTEKGELHPDDFLATQNMQEDSLIHYTDTLGIERTLNRYNSEEDDYYVARRDSSDMIPELIWDYIDGERSGRGGSDYNPGENEGGGNNGGSNSGSNLPGSNGDGNGNNWASQSVWVTRQNVPMMLQTLWDQRGNNELYNHYCPKIGKRRAPVGCVPLAVGQIINYHRYPENLTINGFQIDWSTLSQIHPYGTEWNDSIAAYSQKEMVSHFLAYMRESCWGISVTGKQTFALPVMAKVTLASFGYKNVKRHILYSSSTIVHCLQKGCPVLIAAISGVKDGHAWVIDGYRYQEKIVPESEIVVDKRILFHCNWGWDGYCNGYFASKIFKSKQVPVDFEDDWEEDYDDQYGEDGREMYPYSFKWWFRIITYNNPNLQQDETI